MIFDNVAIADIINGMFEVFASVFILNHCAVLYRHKKVRGVSIISAVFFLVWGFWNLFYYPHLGQLASFYGGVFVCLANLVWISMMVHYNAIEATKETKK